MRTIHKYIINPYDGRVQMPREARILSCRFQGPNACIWALVDTDMDIETRRFLVIPTGAEIEKNLDYTTFIATIHHESWNLVFHVFEVLAK